MAKLTARRTSRSTSSSAGSTILRQVSVRCGYLMGSRAMTVMPALRTHLLGSPTQGIIVARYRSGSLRTTGSSALMASWSQSSQVIQVRASSSITGITCSGAASSMGPRKLLATRRPSRP